MTTFSLRKRIRVTYFKEDENYITISYMMGEKSKFLAVDKKEHTDLMLWVDGAVCQYDCINIICEHEGNVAKEVVHIDMAELQTQIKQLN